MCTWPQIKDGSKSEKRSIKVHCSGAKLMSCLYPPVKSSIDNNTDVH